MTNTLYCPLLILHDLWCTLFPASDIAFVVRFLLAGDVKHHSRKSYRTSLIHIIKNQVLLEAQSEEQPGGAIDLTTKVDLNNVLVGENMEATALQNPDIDPILRGKKDDISATRPPRKWGLCLRFVRFRLRLKGS